MPGMLAEPCAGAGHRPRIRKSRQFSRPWLIGAEPRTMVLPWGSVGQDSRSAMTPVVLVMTRPVGASSGNCGVAGGAVTVSWPNWASVQLILVNNRNPVRAPFCPKRLLLLASLAAAIQAARWTSWRPRQLADTRLRMARTPICEGVRGLAGMPAIRLTSPNGLFSETVRPRLPDCGMSNIFILNLLSFVDLFVVVKWRARPRSEEHTSELQSRQYLVC